MHDQAFLQILLTHIHTPNTTRHDCRLLPATIAMAMAMALQLQIHQVCRPVSSSISPCFAKQSMGDIHRFPNKKSIYGNRNGLSCWVKVRSSLGPSPTVVVGEVTEVSQDTFWPLVKAAGDKTVVLDMYTPWCGPCKVIAPKFNKLAEEYLDVVFLKLDCTTNKDLAKELGIKVVPTFKILKDGKIVKECTGAKFDKLLAAIDEVKSN